MRKHTTQKPRRRRVRPYEEPFQKEVVEFLRRALIPPAFVAAFIQGGRRSSRWACFHGWKYGQRAGMPDLMIFAPGPKILGMELKGRNSPLSDDQKNVRIDLFACNMWFAKCETIGDVLTALRDAHIPLNETIRSEAFRITLTASAASAQLI